MCSALEYSLFQRIILTMKDKKIWFDGKIVAWDKATVHLLTHTLHYGSGAFEGIRAYLTPKGPAVFRLNDHIERFFYSAKVLGIKMPYSKAQITKAILTIVKVNKLEECYIRPIVFYGDKMGLVPKGAPIHVAVAAWPWGKYMAKDTVDVKISKFMRIHPASSVMDAKLSGHYANSVIASIDAKEHGFDEALLLDHRGNIAEGPGENIFFVKNKTLFTPKKGSILPGITRDSVMRIATNLGYTVLEKDIRLKDIKTYEEAFFVGTAVEICPIAKIDQHKFKKTERALEIQKEYAAVVHGNNPVYKKWLSLVR